MANFKYVKWFENVGNEDVPTVGGKNASLGEMIQHLRTENIRVPGGFATTSDAYWTYLAYNNLTGKMGDILASMRENRTSLNRAGEEVRQAIRHGIFPEEVETEIHDAYRELSRRYEQEDLAVAVRSSATAEDLPSASFAGQQETFLNVRGAADLLAACRDCYAFLFTDRAIVYRERLGYDHMKVALSVGVQKMVRSDKAGAGVMFSLDTDTGFPDVVVINASVGLGETVVQGAVTPDEYRVFKPRLGIGVPPREKAAAREGGRVGATPGGVSGSTSRTAARAEAAGAEMAARGTPATPVATRGAAAEAEASSTRYRPIIEKRLGVKEKMIVYAEGGKNRTKTIDTPAVQRKQFVLSDDEIITLARWATAIERHYGRPMDMEWAKDGDSGELYCVQARPETVFSQKKTHALKTYHLDPTGHTPILTGVAVGESIAAGRVKVLHRPEQMHLFQDGEILVTERTDPDWGEIMKKAVAIITDHGGRTSHAAIVSRELGIPAVVGTGNATITLRDGQEITLSCAEGEEGRIYEGHLQYEEHELDTSTLPRPPVQFMINLATPQALFRWWQLPVNGVGLARMEFIINNWIKIHPLALARFNQLRDDNTNARAQIEQLTEGYGDKTEFFVDKLSMGISMIAASQYPDPVIVRTSDFKTNEYAKLIGGAQFEPHEENPMLGFRGASRYYSDRYRDGFALECRAVRKARDVIGLDNIVVMIPFVRTVGEADQVLQEMAVHGLQRGQDGLQVYMMCEVPSNVFLAREFADRFDGFSIGSNDLTQLILGVDRDSETLRSLFDEQNEAVKIAISQVIQSAHEKGVKVGLCGQAPSDYPDFAHFLVDEHIDSISLNPDSVLPLLQGWGKRG